MRSFLINLICILITSSVFAQELSQNLESCQVTTVGEQFVISGYKPLSKGQTFKAYLCDKNLAVLNEYSKELPASTSTFFVGKSGGLFVFTFYGNGQKEKYRIALDASFTEKYAAESVAKKVESTDETIAIADDWNYDASYCNDYIIGDLMIDAQMTGITCYSVLDPIQGTYKKKWEKDFDNNEIYVKMELLGINERIAYFLAVESVPQNLQKLLSINIDDGSVLFTTELNYSDSLDAVSVSTFLVKGDVIYLGGTYILTEPTESFVPTYINASDNQSRGYDELAPYILAGADGYYVMTLNTKGGAIAKMKTFAFPDVDKTVDNRDYRMAVCHGITQLANGKMVAFFEQLSSPHKQGMPTGSGFGGGFGGGTGMTFDSENTAPNLVLWETDAFTSVIFNPDMSDFSSTSMIWEEESSDYDLYDYDLFSSGPMQEVPHDFCTLGEEGCYPQNFVCDGTKWIYHLRGDGEKVPDYLIEITEMDHKAIKLLPPGLLFLQTNKTGIQLKVSGQTIKVKIVPVN